MKKQKGITLISLVITIVVLLILAAISLSVIAGDDGILRNAQNAKTNTEIGDEKEKLSFAIASIKSTNLSTGNWDKIQPDELESALNGKATVEEDGDELIVTYESGRKYIVDSSGNINSYDIEQVEDETPGFITGDGTLENPYVISSIEDLVAFSYNVNELHNGYEGKYIILEKSLDFNSDLSYINPNAIGEIRYEDNLTVIPFNDLNGVNETLKIELTTGKGFVPIGTGESVSPESGYSRQFLGFAGIFDGKNNRIENILINRPENSYVGLFGYNTAVIQNLTISGNITGGEYVGGITAETKNYALKGVQKFVAELQINYEEGAYIRNCTNKANITGYKYVGGIAAHNSLSDWENNSNSAIIENCKNKGKITLSSPESDSYVGGIIGYNGSLDYPDYAPTAYVEVLNCINNGEIVIENPQSNDIYVGGIAGANIGGTNNYTVIYNCINNNDIINDIEANIYIGGIAGIIKASKDSGNGNKDTVIESCINNGIISSAYISGGIAGTAVGGSKNNTVLNITRCENHNEINRRRDSWRNCGIFRFWIWRKYNFRML